MWKSSQDTRAIANDASIKKAGKNAKIRYRDTFDS